MLAKQRICSHIRRTSWSNGAIFEPERHGFSKLLGKPPVSQKPAAGGFMVAIGTLSTQIFK